MPILINGLGLLPAPLLTFSKEYFKNEGGEIVGAGYTANFEGDLIQNKGNPIATTGTSFTSTMSTDGWVSTYSPDDDPLHGVATEDLLMSTLVKQERIRDLFSPGSGIKVEVVGFNHDRGIKFYGTVSDISFDKEGRWAKPTKYNISMSFPQFIEPAISGLFTNSEDDFNYLINSSEDSWSIQEEDRVVVNTGDFTATKVYTVSHNRSAQGQPRFTGSGYTPAWQEASGYVRTGLGFSNMPSGILAILADNYTLANHALNETIDKAGGSYTTEESFLLYQSGISPYAIEDFSISTEYGEGSLNTVSIQGTIDGLNSNDPTSSSGNNKYGNALNYYNTIETSIYGRVLSNCGLSWIHPLPLTKSVGRLPNAGQVSYNYTFDTRPPNLVPGSISESITISDTYPGQIFSSTPVIGREQSILSYLGSRTNYQRTLNISVNMNNYLQNWTNGDVDSSGYWSGATTGNIFHWLVERKPSVTQTAAFSGIYEAANPIRLANVVSTKVFYGEPQESWDFKAGLYTFATTWTYEKS